jgi:glycerol-3-phosphate acyltransferase PlsY
MPWEWIGLLTMAYLVGSLPSAYIAGRLLKGVDIRDFGDRNSGTANACKVLGIKVGIAVGAVDIGKGIAVIFIARALAGSLGWEMVAGVVGVAGHNWPFFLQFRGGRGAATAVGVLLILLPRAMIPLSLLSMIPLFITRSTTIALACIFIPLPLVAWYTGASYPLIAYSVGLPVMVGVSHHISVRRTQRAMEREARGRPLPPG